MNPLMNLAERAEAATGPDRELEADIALTQGWTECAGDNWIGPHGEIAVPAYTSSLDAAMQLVPEGMAYGLKGPVSEYVYGEDAGKHSGSCGSVPEDGFIALSLAKTPELALCAAALRAKAATQ